MLASGLLNITLLEVYTNTTLFFQTVIVAYCILFIMLKIAEKFLPNNKLLEISVAKVYSEIMAGIATLMFIVILLDSQFLMSIPPVISFIISTASTIFFVLIMYFCLFFFNAKTVVLRPYRRKADEAVSLHGKMLEKKVAAEYKLYRDDLTKLYNRRFVYSKIDELCETENAAFGLIYADLVGLKKVNDLYGHRVGDKYIINVARILEKAIREDDYSARVGGDEFVIILSDITKEALDEVVQRIRKLIKKLDKKEDFTVYANLGSMVFNETGKKKTRSELLEMVDALMKEDKNAFYAQGGI